MDFDLDCISDDVEKILGAADKFSSRGIEISPQLSMAPQRVSTFESTGTPLYCNCIHIDRQGHRVGDLYIYTEFSDGIARRFDLVTGTYANAKMALPAWFYSGREMRTIGGREFPTVLAPEVVLEKIYGPDWRIPIAPGQFAKGRNATSGSVPDADIETLILYALRNGWSGNKSPTPVWPQRIQWVGWPAEVSRNWIFRHEPLLVEEVRSLLEGNLVADIVGNDAADKVKMLMRVAAAKAVQGDRKRQAEGLGLAPKRTLLQRISRRFPIMRSCKALLQRVHKLAAGRS